MFALTVNQPWAWALLHFDKIENRGWPFPEEFLGQRIAIHAGKTVDPDGAQFLWDVFGIEVPDALPLGAFVGTLRLVGLVEQRERRDLRTIVVHRWVDGFELTDRSLKWLMEPRPGKRGYGWVGAERRLLREPIAARGALKLWQLTEDQRRVVEFAEVR